MCKHCKRNDCPDISNEYWCTVHKQSSRSRPGKSFKFVTLKEESERLGIDINKMISDNFWDLLGR